MRTGVIAAALPGLALTAASVAGQGPQVYDAEVGPWKLEAEDYLWYTNASIWDELAASGGKVANRPGYSYTLLDDPPFPRTSRPVTVYLRSGTREAARLAFSLQGVPKNLGLLRHAHGHCVPCPL